MYRFILFALSIFLIACSVNDIKVKETTKDELGSGVILKKQQARYNFSHKILPGLFFSNPKKVINLINKQGNEYFKSIINKNGNPKAYDYSEIRTAKIEDNGREFLLINLPRPEATAEVYLIALVLENKEPRYFVLEKLEPDANNRPDEPVFCEWNKSGKHLNYGISMSGMPTHEDFMSVINAALSGQIHPLAGLGL
jgi:hypothetical protein